jgi:hypothetical protein
MRRLACRRYLAERVHANEIEPRPLACDVTPTHLFDLDRNASERIRQLTRQRQTVCHEQARTRRLFKHPTESTHLFNRDRTAVGSVCVLPRVPHLVRPWGARWMSHDRVRAGVRAPIPRFAPAKIRADQPRIRTTWVDIERGDSHAISTIGPSCAIAASVNRRSIFIREAMRRAARAGFRSARASWPNLIITSCRLRCCALEYFIATHPFNVA